MSKDKGDDGKVIELSIVRGDKEKSKPDTPEYTVESVLTEALQAGYRDVTIVGRKIDGGMMRIATTHPDPNRVCMELDLASGEVSLFADEYNASN